MAYATPDELRGSLSGQGPTDPATAASLDDQQLLGAIADAQTEIDATLAVRYPTPFDDPDWPEHVPVPALVKTITLGIAGYLATLTYLRGAPLDPQHPVALRYTRARGLMAQVANGHVRLDLEAGPPENQPAEISDAGAGVVNPYAGTMFTPSDYGIGFAPPGRRRVGGGFPNPDLY